MSSSLKLRAVDAEDVQVVSAVLQDAIVPVIDMLWQPHDQQFVMVTQRLCREKAGQPRERICCAVNLTGVEAAQLQGIDLNDGDRMLDLLALLQEGDYLRFVFAGTAAIRLKLGQWSMIVEDFGEPWPAQCDPRHETGESC